MERFKAALLWTGFAVVFAIVFALMFLLLSAAVIGVPVGLMLGFFGAVTVLFKADFVITGIAPEILAFGGVSAAAASAFLGLLAVKAGFAAGRLFLKTKKRCDRLRGW